jgi:DNA repair exonuclease SbcCD ATPase subunit
MDQIDVTKTTVQPFVVRNPDDMYFIRRNIGKLYTWTNHSEGTGCCSTTAKLAVRFFGLLAQAALCATVVGIVAVVYLQIELATIDIEKAFQKAVKNQPQPLPLENPQPEVNPLAEELRLAKETITQQTKQLEIAQQEQATWNEKENQALIFQRNQANEIEKLKKEYKELDLENEETTKEHDKNVEEYNALAETSQKLAKGLEQALNDKKVLTQEVEKLKQEKAESKEQALSVENEKLKQQVKDVQKAGLELVTSQTASLREQLKKANEEIEKLKKSLKENAFGPDVINFESDNDTK